MRAWRLLPVLVAATFVVPRPAAAQSPFDSRDLKSLGGTLITLTESGETSFTAQTYNIQSYLATLRTVSAAGSGAVAQNQSFQLASTLANSEQLLAQTGPIVNVVDEFGFFINASYFRDNISERDVVDGALGFRVKTEVETSAITVGADYRIPFERTNENGDVEVTNDLITIGGAFGFSQTTGTGGVGVTSEYNNFDFFVYSLITPTNEIWIDAIVGVGYMEGRQVHGVPFDIVGEIDAVKFNGTFAAGYDLFFDPVTVTPQVGLDLSTVRVDGFDEQEDVPFFAQNFDDFNDNTINSSVGVRAASAFSTGFGVVQPYAEGFWIHEFLDEDTADTTQQTTGLQSTVAIEEVDRNYARIGGGVTVVFANDFNITLGYTGVFFNDIEDSHGFTVGAGKRF